MGQFEQLDVMHCNFLRRMITGGFKCIGDNVETFDISLIVKNLVQYAAHLILAISFKNSKMIMLLM